LSYEGDDLELTIAIYYNAQASTSIVQSDVETAISNYIYSQDFDGLLLVNRIIDQIQAVADVYNGVINRAYIDNVNNRGNGTTFTVETQLLSGYVRNITYTFNFIPR
jgi:hypothetical protein